MTPYDAVSEVLKAVIDMAKPGVNLLDLEKRAEATMDLLGAKSANLGYQPSWARTPFPSSICLGVNNVIAHGIPHDYELQDGDLLTIDCGLIVDKQAADAGITIGIGNVNNRDERLLRYTRQAIYVGIEEIKPGALITDVGIAISRFAGRNGYVVNRSMFGHGIGKTMHEEPSIPHYDVGYEQVEEDGKFSWKEREEIPTFTLGQVVCIEPMLTIKDPFGMLDADGWTFKTRDGLKSAFIEHMVKVVPGGAQILTTHI